MFLPLARDYTDKLSLLLLLLLLPVAPCPPGQSIVCKPSEPVESYTYGSVKIVFHRQTSNCGVGMAAVCDSLITNLPWEMRIMY